MKENEKIKTALITGGSRGIGKEICLMLASEGIQIVTCYAHGEQQAQETVRECEEKGVRALALQADVSKEEDVEKLFHVIREEFGTLDILVNNAGITQDDLLMRMSVEKFMKVIEINLKGSFLCTKAASAMMLRNRSGKIIFISSVVGVHGNAGQANYASSKAALIGLAKSTAKELGSRGITANVVAPGFMETDMTASLTEETRKKYEEQIPLRRLGRAQDVAAAVAFLASEKAGYITGQVLLVDGGMGM
jgi:3-oxoacyl-[acyl-carrier protein] reductase